MVDDGFTGEWGDVVASELDAGGVDVECDDLSCGIGMGDSSGDQADRSAAPVIESAGPKIKSGRLT